MISLVKEAKSLLTRFGGARVQVLFDSSARRLASRPWFLPVVEPDTHDKSCQGGKKPPDALRRSAGTSSLRFLSSPVGLAAVVPTRCRTRHPLAVSAHLELPQKIELLFSCQSRNKSTGASGDCAPSLSRINGKTWQAAC